MVNYGCGDWPWSGGSAVASPCARARSPAQIPALRFPEHAPKNAVLPTCSGSDSDVLRRLPLGGFLAWRDRYRRQVGVLERQRL